MPKRFRKAVQATRAGGGDLRNSVLDEGDRADIKSDDLNSEDSKNSSNSSHSIFSHDSNQNN